MALGSIGAGISAILGGIAGAISGRMISNKVHNQPFDRALKELKDSPVMKN
ncbi:hypothetical protein [Brevibacillus porteri]|uniref:hypothetical protein n=1 Tax=Brevibacillus porteri TaxID=2126350 RepID=UPI003642EB26